MIVIGASLGGFRALSQILAELPPKFPAPIAVALHRAKDTPDLLAPLLQVRTALTVFEVTDKQSIENAHVYVAPADYHLLIDRDCFSLSTEAPVNFARPSVDVLFESAADIFGDKTIAVVLTGSGQDGAMGAAAIVAAGGKVIVEDPIAAECPQMPSATLARVKSAQVSPLSRIASLLTQLV